MERAPLSDLQLITLQADTLFLSDPDGRLRYVREPGYAEPDLEPAPRLFLGRTRLGHIWRFRHDLPNSLVGELTELCQAAPRVVSLAAPPPTIAAIRDALEAHTAITHEERGPAFWISNLVPASSMHTSLVREANAHLLNEHFPWKRTSLSGVATGLLAATIVGGSAVSICYCARLTNRAAEAGVETIAAARGRGYASAAVAVWAAAVLQRGLLPLYSTSWENGASRGVARKLGMYGYAEDWSIW
jgi:RimJ/RimL family protein N-acetyltransferase